MKDFTDKLVLVTGAGSGIGRETAVAFARHGARIFAIDLSAAALDDTATMIRSGGGQCDTRVVDVSNADAMRAMAAEVHDQYGAVDVLVNNAGRSIRRSLELTFDRFHDFERTMQLNYFGAIRLIMGLAPSMLERRAGHVINISSVFGLFSQPTQSGYNATKFAVRGFTESLRQELDIADGGVSATCVHPGGIKTNIARAARTNESIEVITGSNKEESYKKIEAQFRTTADDAAKIILAAVRKNKRRVLVGVDAKLIDVFQRVLPTAYQRIVGGAVKAGRI